MTALQYSRLAAWIFALVALAHIARAVMGLPITLGETSIPIWASWLAFVVATVLAWLGYAAAKG